MWPEIIHRLIYGLISGLAHILPVSAEAHQMLYSHLLNFHPGDPWLRVCCFLGAFAGLYVMLYPRIRYILRENRHLRNTRRSKSHPPEPSAVCTAGLIKVSLIVLIPSVLVAGFAGILVNNFIILAIVLFFNGVLLFIPRLISTGNKNALTMSRLDILLTAGFGVLGILPGFSRLGAMATGARIRGVNKQFSLDISLLMLLIVMGVLTICCLIGAVISRTEMNVWMVFGDIFAAIASFAGSCAGVWGIRKILENTDMSGFCFYSWGVALTAFVLYLIN